MTKNFLVAFFLMIILFMVVSRLISCSSESKVNPIYPGAVKSPDYSLEVNGKPVFVNNHPDYRTDDSRMGYAQFTVTGKVTLKITYLKGDITTCQISPLDYEIEPKIEGNSVTFEIDRPLYLIAFFNKGNQPNFMSDGLILFAEAPEEAPAKIGDINVINILDYEVDITGKKAETDKINKAINDASLREKGGIVFFPKGGVYCTGSILMKSNVYLYIEEGALIQASDNLDDYAAEKGADKREVNAIIKFENIENAGIQGRGTIDLNGYPELFLKREYGTPQSLVFNNCKNITLKDVTLKRSLSWTIHLIDCDYFNTKNIKIINRKTRYWEDGYDIDISRHVLIENGFAMSMDDMWAIKGTQKGQSKPVEDIKISGFLAYTFDSGLALGYYNSELGYPYVKNLTLEDIHFVSTMADWGIFVSYEKMVGEQFDIVDPAPSLENWLFKNLTFEDGGTILIATGKSNVRNFAFENIRSYNTGTGNKGIIRGNFTDSISFKGVINLGNPVVNVNDLSKIGSGISVGCPVKFIPSDNDAYLYASDKGIEAYKKGDYKDAFVFFNNSIKMNPNYAKSHFFRGVIKTIFAEENRINNDTAYLSIIRDARRDMQRAEDLGYSEAKEYKEKYNTEGIYLFDYQTFEYYLADLRRRVLFTLEGEMPLAR